uniref:Uncharacterized protein LOC114348912 n=1 Tax=Diabrotica virgifera virgifera TaxID=50390 RepID=A0A6P7HC13_DIAVI
MLTDADPPVITESVFSVPGMYRIDLPTQCISTDVQDVTNSSKKANDVSPIISESSPVPVLDTMVLPIHNPTSNIHVTNAVKKIPKHYYVSPIHSNESDVDDSDADPNYNYREADLPQLQTTRSRSCSSSSSLTTSYSFSSSSSSNSDDNTTSHILQD